MISKEMVKNGYESGIIRLELSPNDDGVVCFIGDNWFYFGGMTAEEASSVEEYQRDIPKECIIDDIYNVLESFRKDGEAGHEEFADEYLYYDYFLREHGIKTLYAFFYIWGDPGLHKEVTLYNINRETAKSCLGYISHEDGYIQTCRVPKKVLNKPDAYTYGKDFVVRVVTDALSLEKGKAQAEEIIRNYIQEMANKIGPRPTGIK